MSKPMKPITIPAGKRVDPLLRVTTGYVPNYNAINLSNSTIAGSSSMLLENASPNGRSCSNNNTSDLVLLL